MQSKPMAPFCVKAPCRIAVILQCTEQVLLFFYSVPALNCAKRNPFISPVPGITGGSPSVSGWTQKKCHSFLAVSLKLLWRDWPSQQMSRFVKEWQCPSRPITMNAFKGQRTSCITAKKKVQTLVYTKLVKCMVNVCKWVHHVTLNCSW